MTKEYEVSAEAGADEETGLDELILPLVMAHIQSSGLPENEIEATAVVKSAQALIDALAKHAEANDGS